MEQLVYLIGAGMGTRDTMTVAAVRAAQECAVLVGAARLLEPWQGEKPCRAMVAAREIAAFVRECGESPIGVLLSGDTGFYSGAQRLRPLLEGCRVVTLPGVSSLSYFCARLGVSWSPDLRVVSAHGRSCDVPGEIQCHARTFALTGGAVKAQDICRELTERGLGDVRVTVGERLGGPEERIVEGTAQELAGQEFADLSVLLAENPRPVTVPAQGPGQPDGAFLRGEAPMTKEEVRALCLRRLRLEPGHTVWDVGAGTGSVSVECALSCPRGRVFAVEKDPAALALLGTNRARFGLSNLTVVEGTAPRVLEDLPAPDRVFLGGTSGALEEMLALIFRKNPAARVVCTAVTMETVGKAAPLFARLKDADMVQLSAVRTRPAGRYHLMDAQNPVWIFSGEGEG